jgi:hypothetical protein
MIQLRFRDRLPPDLNQMLSDLRSPEPMQAAGQGVVALLREHFREAERTRPNRRGWPRQHFWAQFARRVSLGPTTPARAIVQIQDPQGALRHKIDGGTITPKRGRALAIPLTAEAYKKGAQARIRDAFPEAFVMRTKKGAWIVRAKFQTRGTGRRKKGIQGQRLEFLFKLVPRVTHSADPRALPDESAIAAAAIGAVEGWFARRLAQSR